MFSEFCKSSHFSFFNDVVEHANETLCLMWWTQVETLTGYASFYFSSKLYMFHATNVTTRVVGMVSKEIWAKVVNFMKQQCALTIASFITKLENVFWCKSC
jgi:hypothetical protein